MIFGTEGLLKHNTHKLGTFIIGCVELDKIWLYIVEKYYMELFAYILDFTGKIVLRI